MSGPKNVPDIALQSAERFGNLPAVVDGEVVLSFVDVKEQMVAVAASLLASGVERGDRVALWAPNSAAWITSALGILASGASLVPLNTRFTGHEVVPILETVDARMVLAADQFLGPQRLDTLMTEGVALRSTQDLVLLPDPGIATRPEWDTFLRRGSNVGDDEVMNRIANIGSDDVSDVMFTSGTTGKAKGVMLRHGTTLRAYAAVNASFGLEEGDRILIGLPFFHCFGYKAGWMLALLSGATSYPLAVFDEEVVMAMVSRHAITHLPGSPTMFLPLLESPSRSSYDLSSIRVALLGGAFTPVELVRRLKAEVGIERMLNGYGLTETHAIVAISRPEDSAELVATTVGKVLDDVEVVTVDSDGRPQPNGIEGELLVRGYTQMTGYYGDPEATAAAYSDDGWLKTGDVGVIDEEGYVRITDRKKDIFITGGFNVAPAEIENVLAYEDRIAQVAVVGVADHRMGEVGAAFVVPAGESHITPDDVVAVCREKLASFKVPRYVYVVDALPTNAMGKILKDVLHAEHVSRSNSSPS